MTDESHIDLLDEEGPDKAGGQPARISKAVAVEYDAEKNAAPMVTASGRGVIADQILALAFANGIKVREDADLVEVLEKIEVDSPIPLQAFTAVAEILAHVYKANASMKQRRAQTMHKEDT